MIADNSNNLQPTLLAITRILLVFFLVISPSQSARTKKPGLPSSLPTMAHRVALVIGNSDYLTEKLKNPENDALSVANKLASLGFTVDYYTNLDQQAMVQHFFDFFHHKAAKSLLRVVYFAGHGVQFQGKNYLIPVDANLSIPADIPQNSFQLDELRRNLDALKQGASIIILDNCRVNLCPAPPCRGIMSSLDLSGERRSSGTLVAYSTGPGRLANDGGENGHSLYTQNLVDLLGSPGLPVEKMFRQLTQNVFNRSGGQQKPEFVDGLMGDEICFKTGPLGECPLK